MRKTTTLMAILFAAATTSTALAQDDTAEGMEQDMDQMETQTDQMENQTDQYDQNYDQDMNADNVNRLEPESNLFGPTQGDIQIAVSGSGNNDKEFDQGGGALNLDVGYFATDAVEVGVRQGLTYAETASDDSLSAATTVYGDYHFNIERFRPFIGLNLGYLYGEDTNNSFIAGPEAGVKWYVKDETFVFVRGEYQFTFEDADDANEAFDDGRFVYTLGIGFNY